MVRKFVSATVSAALCIASVLPGIAAAQDYRFAGYDAPQGATATVNLRVPLTTQRQARQRMSYGLTLGYGSSAGSPTMDGTSVTRQVNVADLRFNGEATCATRGCSASISPISIGIAGSTI